MNERLRRGEEQASLRDVYLALCASESEEEIEEEIEEEEEAEEDDE